MIESQLSTGLPGLDRVLRGVLPGDNLVWQMESLADFTPFAKAFCKAALAEGRKLVYFRFADHEPLVPESLAAEVHVLHGRLGVRAVRDRSVSGDSRSGPGDVLHLRLPLEHRRRLVQRSDDRQLLHAGVPRGPRLPIAGLFSTDPPPAQFSRLGPDHRNHANPHRRVSPSRAVLYSSHEGRKPLLLDDAHAAPLGGRPLRSGDGELDHGRSSHVASLGGLESVRLRPGGWTRTFFHAEEISEKIRRGKLPAEAAARSASPAAAHGDLPRRAGRAAGRSTSPSPTWWKSGSG